MKKVMALFLAMALCMALAVSAMAGGVSIASGGNISDGNTPLEYTTKLQEPTIKVTVPGAAQTLVLNPYNIKVKSTSAVGSGDALFGSSVGSGNDGSVLAAKLYLKNESDVPLKMSLTATGAIAQGSKATFNTAKVTATEKTKKVFLFVDVGQTADIKSGDGNTTLSPALSEVTADQFATNKKYQAVVKVGDTKLVDVLEIPTPDSMGGTFNYATIQVGGNCTTTPTDKWEATDLVTLKLVFSFQATNNTPAA